MHKCIVLLFTLALALTAADLGGCMPWSVTLLLFCCCHWPLSLLITKNVLQKWRCNMFLVFAGFNEIHSDFTTGAWAPAAASNVTLPAAAKAANSSNPSITAASAKNTATGLSIDDKHTSNASAAQWHGSRRHHGGGGAGSGSDWQDGWQGGFQVDESDDRWSAALTACPPGQGRPTPSEACQLCPYGRYSPGQ